MRMALRKLQWVLPASPSGGVSVLAYHLVGGETGSVVDLPLEAFRRHLDWLRRHACVCPLVQMHRLLRQGALPAGRPTVVLTFDDAYANFYEQAFPLLVERGMPSTLYVPTGFVDGTAPAPIIGTEHLDACTWAQLAEMQRSGLVEIGAHTRSHPKLTQVPLEWAREEIAASQAVLERRLGAKVTSFCYPVGLWNRRLERVVGLHYRTAVVGGGVQERPGQFNPLRLRRKTIRSDGPASLQLLVESPVWLEEWAADQARRRVVQPLKQAAARFRSGTLVPPPAA